MSANLESIIAAALVAHKGDHTQDHWWIICKCGENWPVGGVVKGGDAPAEFAAHQARAVLDALTQAGGVEWATGEGADLMKWRDRGQAERQSASATKSTDGGKTWQRTNPPVVSRIVGPWTAVKLESG